MVLLTGSLGDPTSAHLCPAAAPDGREGAVEAVKAQVHLVQAPPRTPGGRQLSSEAIVAQLQTTQLR